MPKAEGLQAPVLEAIDVDFREERFKYSLWYQSPFKGPPTPQVEQAWHSIMKCKNSSPSIVYSLSYDLTLYRWSIERDSR